MYIGFDIGGTNIKGLLADKDGTILNFRKIPILKSIGEIEDSLINLITELASSDGKSLKKIKAIGIGSAGTIDKARGIVITSANIPAWKKYNLVKAVEKKTGIRTFLENDANAAIIGEWWKGNGKKFSNWIMITLGTGIGGGVIINNEIYTGKSGSAMEIGHTTIDYNGRKCYCGNTGCFEQYASATAIVRSAEKQLKKNPDSSVHMRLKREKITSKLIYEEAQKGDKFAKSVFDEASVFLGIGISNLISIFNPEAIIFGGGLSDACKIMIPIVKQVVKERVQPGLKENIKYLTITNQEKTPALGAVKVAIDSCESYKYSSGLTINKLTNNR
ncbi:MAG: ROK family protein [Spirochaetes bacterium]|nr:ROK family protein [Spirochaetota bacterium]